MHSLNNITQPNEFSIEIDPFYEQDLLQMAVATNYLKWQFNLVQPYLGKHVLEIGGGIGNFTSSLATTAESVISLEPNVYCYNKLKQATAAINNVTIYNIAAEQLNNHVASDYLADTVICMNVLEHIQDDAEAVQTFSQRLKVGGNMVLLIPAVPWVFGDIDRRLGHYRRYSKQSITSLLHEVGMEISVLRYFNFIGLWGWLWNTRVFKKQQQSNGQIYFFDKYLVPWLSKAEQVVPVPIGQSLLVVSIKTQS